MSLCELEMVDKIVCNRYILDRLQRQMNQVCFVLSLVPKMPGEH